MDEDPCSEPDSPGGSRHEKFSGFYSVNSGKSQRGVPSNFDGPGGADLDAGKTLPALVRLLVAGLHGIGVEDHEIVGADVHASGLFAMKIALENPSEIYYKCIRYRPVA